MVSWFLLMTSYQHAPTVPAAAAAELSAYSPLVQQLLYTRGIDSATAAAAFLTPCYDTQLHSPWLLHDMDKAVARLEQALAAKEHIVIYSDYDCDGIPGGVVFHDLLTALGHEQFDNHIPHRHYDGFGLHVAAVEKLVKTGATLLVTVDCGTTDVAAIERANELGMDVIVTDHHQSSETLPSAVAVVNPQVGDTYPFTGLCGAAVVYKVAQALLERVEHSLVPGQEKWWLDMVGLATVADMVPLIDENRVFAHYGLLVLKKTRRPGLQQLLRKQRVNPRYLTEDDIGFTIGPRINAASRMDTPEEAFQLLATLDEGEAGALVTGLEKLNNERKGVVAAMTREAHTKLKQWDIIPPVIVVGNPDWRPSLVGLVANKLAEEHGRPAFVWGRDGNGVLKGSARAGGEASVHAIMHAGQAAFSEWGGHHQAGGFSVEEAAIHTLGEQLVAAYESLGEAVMASLEMIIDATLTLDELTGEVLRAQEQLAPYGMANPKPLLQITEVVPTAVECFGKGKEHTKLVFATNGVAKEAIAFFRTPEQFSVTPEASQSHTLHAHLEQSFFMNRLQTRLRIVDILP